MEQDARLWRDAGLDGCLAKPFRVEDVARIVLAQAEPAAGPSAPAGPGTALVALPDLLADLKDLGRDRMRSLVELFRTSSSADLDQVRTSIPAGDLARLGATAHRMASAAASLHLLALNERCRAIETLARAEDTAALTLAGTLPDLWQRSLKALLEVVE
ncbi:MAG: Hpt domain-containing protein [Magnetospirillum sp.]|nr:Hpt domain-containing protein [Magnetospirillum sp.]